MKIFYFTGTGNSYVVAKGISKKTKAPLIPIASIVSDADIDINCDCIGIVFPVYFASNDCGIPLIIRRFLNNIASLKHKYVFAVCTSEHTPGTTLESVASLIEAKDGMLSAGFVVNTSLTTLKDNIKGKFSKSKTSHINKGVLNFDDKINYIVEAISRRQVVKIESRTKLAKIFMAPLMPLMRSIFRKRYQNLTGRKEKRFMDYINYVDNSFCVNDKCTGCITCKNVCPVDNINIIHDKPSWNNKCENCLACYQFCPNNAIGGKIVEYNKRYHHPSVTISDMISQKKGIK